MHAPDSTASTTFAGLPPITQMVRRDGFAEFSWGHPDPDLLPVSAMRRATETALDTFGSTALEYGAAEGVWPLLAWIRERAATTEGLTIGLDEILGSAGNSDALDQICTLFTKPGDIALVESPTYHIALRIMQDHALDLRAVPMDEQGLRVDLLDAMLARLAAAGTPARLLYTIPTFHNPTGVSLSAERRRTLVDLAVRHALLVVEDDVYREMAFDGPAPPALFGLAPRGTVLRMGSLSKTLAPGLRLGWINGSAAHMRRIADGGLRDSGGSPSYFTGMMVSALCRAGDFDRQLTRVRAEYRTRRDALVGALAEYLPADCRFVIPGGGFFVWVTLPEQIDADAVTVHADAHKVTFIAGRTFCIDGGGRNALRLGFGLMKPDALIDGAKRLGAAVRDTLSGA